MQAEFHHGLLEKYLGLGPGGFEPEDAETQRESATETERHRDLCVSVADFPCELVLAP
jgi:hypothetical protein